MLFSGRLGEDVSASSSPRVIAKTYLFPMYIWQRCRQAPVNVIPVPPASTIISAEFTENGNAKDNGVKILSRA